MAWFDLTGLDDMAYRLRQTPAELATARLDGTAALGQLGHWADRARVDELLAGRETALVALADDLSARSVGMAFAESAVSALSFGDDPYSRFYEGAGYYADGGIREQVAEALEKIEDLLRTDGTKIGWFSIGDTEVKGDELEAIAEIMLGLEPPALRALLMSMDDDLLAKWLDEADESDIDGDLERRLFEYLAEHGGSVLARLVILSDDDTQDRLLAAIDEHSADWVKSWVFRTVAERVGDLDDGPDLLVETFEMLNPDQRGRSVGALARRGLLDDVVAALVVYDRDTHTTGSMFGTGHVTTIHRYDAGPLTAFIELLPSDGHADAKAEVFVAAVDSLEGRLADASENIDPGFGHSSATRFVDDSGTDALYALAAMLAADAGPIYDALRLEHDRFGTVTSDYMRELFREPGNRGTIYGEPLSEDGAIHANQILGELMAGGLDPEDRARFFTELSPTVEGDLDYVNAARLGYFMGTVSGALDDLGTSTHDDWKALGVVLGVAGLVDPTKVSKVAKVANSALTTIATEITERNVEELRLEYRELELLMLEGIVPQVNGRIYDGDARDEFMNEYDLIGGGVVGE